MKSLTFLGVLRWSLVSLAVALQAPADVVANDASVDMTASADSFTFAPDHITARVGELETIEVRSIGGIHGIASQDFGIDTTVVRPGHPVTIAFTPKSPGAYTVHCAFVCGIGHRGMAFSVNVLP